jgi:hypothetical protein
LHSVLIVAGNHHALSAHSGIYELGQMGHGLFWGNLLHPDLLLTAQSGAAPAQYSIAWHLRPRFGGMVYNARLNVP